MKKIIKVALLALTATALFSCGNGKQSSNSGTWTVQFMLNNGTEDVYKEIVVENNKSITESIADPTRNGYTFDGWYVDQACTVYFDEAGDTVTSDMKVYAKWAASGIANPDTPGQGDSGDVGDVGGDSGETNALPGSTDAPTEGYAIVINGTNYVSLTHNTEYKGDGQEWYVKGLQLEEGYELTMYNGSSSEGWIIKTPDPYSSGSWTAGTDSTGIICNESDTYDVYCKMIYQNDNIYFGPAGA